jgi:predicted histidine transporter YuiF (NhaC family)
VLVAILSKNIISQHIRFISFSIETLLDVAFKD